MIKEEVQYDESNIPNECFCPITQEIMEDPVIAQDGHTYERTAIEQWFRLGKRISPKTGARLLTTELTPNHTMRSLIGDIKANVPVLARHKLVIENIEAAVKLREEDIQIMLQDKGELLNQEKQKNRLLAQTLVKENEGLRRENSLLRDELQKLKQENEQRIEMLNKKAESDMHKLKEQLEKAHLSEIEEVKQTIKKEVLNLNTLLNRLESTIPQPQQSINPAQTTLSIFSSPKPAAKKQLTAAEQTRQNEFIEAILKADLEKVKALHTEGALLTEPDKNQMYPLVAAAYSADMETLKYIEEQLGQKADTYWTKVDPNEVQERVAIQIPEKININSTPTLLWLADWYSKNAEHGWCNKYDEKCLAKYGYDGWLMEDWNFRANAILENHREWMREMKETRTNHVCEIFECEINEENDEGEATYLCLPSLFIHNEISEEITESLNQFDQYVQSKVAQYHPGAKLK